jgi:uncharacterized membrane protein YcaP (DUF421 family)
VILYLLLIIGIRLMGKHQVGELEPSELVLAMLISDLASVPMQDFGIPLLNGVIPIITLLAITMILSVLTVHSLRMRTLICGRPSIIVERGRLKQTEMKKNRFTVDELMEELRQQGVTDISTVEFAILETSGQLSVLLFSEFQTVTSGRFPPVSGGGGLPIPLINDGRLILENLKLRGVDETWLKQQISMRGFSRYEEIFLLTVDQDLRVYFSPKEVSS